MSHNPERKEKDCLNCGTQVAGRFCQVCGQENIETKESFWSLTKHFVYDIFHFDGKFFHTLGFLFSKPGFAARQYVAGKRASYLHPIRMYLFMSAVFFLVLFSTRSFNLKAAALDEPMTNEDRVERAESYKTRLEGKPADSTYKKRIALLLDTVAVPRLTLDFLVGDDDWQAVRFTDGDYRTVEEYDSVQAAKSADEKDNWFERRLTLQSIKVNDKYKGAEGSSRFIEVWVHKFPYLFFVSLPFFAGILKLLYVRRRQFFYSDHAVFTLYHYIFTFILFLALLLLSDLQKWTGWRPVGWLMIGLALAWPVYLFLQMKRFYGQGIGKTFVKFLLLNFLAFALMVILLLLFLFLSIFQV